MFKKPPWWPKNRFEALELKKKHDDAWQSGKVYRVYRIEKYLPMLTCFILVTITGVILTLLITDNLERITASIVSILVIIFLLNPRLPSSDENLVRALIDTEKFLKFPLVQEKLDFLACMYPDIWGSDKGGEGIGVH